jgi:hypothetical protein
MVRKGVVEGAVIDEDAPETRHTPPNRVFKAAAAPPTPDPLIDSEPPAEVPTKSEPPDESSAFESPAEPMGAYVSDTVTPPPSDPE